VVEGYQRLILGVVARVIGFPHALQDHIHQPQDIIDCTWILGDPQDRRHTSTLQNLGHVPHQGSQPAGLDGMIRHDILKKPPKLNELHQLIMIIPGVEPPGLRLHQCCYVKFPVSLPSIELNLFLCQDLVKVKDELATSGVSLHLVEVHRPGSIGLGPLRVKGSADLEDGLFQNPRHILPCSKGFLPSCELPVLHNELLHRYSQRLHCGRAGRQRGRNQPVQGIQVQISDASSDVSTYCMGRLNIHVPEACA
jgi:hypothetical protein